MTYNHRAPAPSCTYGNTSGQDVPPHMLLMRCADSVFHVFGQFQRIQVPKSVVVVGGGETTFMRVKNGRNCHCQKFCLSLGQISEGTFGD